jgi:hypothetical protein
VTKSGTYHCPINSWRKLPPTIPAYWILSIIRLTGQTQTSSHMFPPSHFLWVMWHLSSFAGLFLSSVILLLLLNFGELNTQLCPPSQQTEV